MYHEQFAELGLEDLIQITRNQIREWEGKAHLAMLSIRANKARLAELRKAAKPDTKSINDFTTAIRQLERDRDIALLGAREGIAMLRELEAERPEEPVEDESAQSDEGTAEP